MPVGVIKWFDETSGEGRIDKRGKVFAVAAGSEVDPQARIPGVRVHFDIERVDGVARATRIVALVGTRTSHRHHRFGDRSGAHDNNSSAAPALDRYNDVVLASERRPRRILLELVRRLANGEFAAARPLLAPDVVLRRGDETIVGVAAVFDALAESPLSGNGELPVNISFEDDTADGRIIVDWINVAEQTGEEHTLSVSFRVAHGEVAEIDWGITHVVSSADDRDELPDIQVVSLGPVSKSAVAYCREKLSVVMRLAPPPVLFARLKLTQHVDPAATRPATAQATIDLDGRILRGFANGDTMSEATDLLESRLVERLRHLRHGGGDERAEHSHTNGHTSVTRSARADQRPPRVIPTAERQIIRHKTIADGAMTVDEALWDLHQLDFDFYLFTDLETGNDALVTAVDDTVRYADAVPTLDATAAKEWLDTTGEPSLFHAGPDGRGRMMYRRYDGHYGLLTL